MLVLEEIPCDLCGSDSHELLFTKRENRSWWIRKCQDDERLDEGLEFSIKRCTNCDHVFVNPRLRADINADIYARYWRDNEPADLARNEYGNYVCRQLARIGGLGKLLDFGCGWGKFLDEAQRLGWEAVGLEVDEKKVAFCREHGMTAVVANLLEDSFDAESFDAVIAEQVFEHLYEPVPYVKAINRVLKPGGVFTISVPNLGGLAARIQGPRWDMIHPVSHVRYFDRRTLSRLLSDHGFQVVPAPVVRRYSGLKEAAHRIKLMVERTTGFYPFGLGIFAIKL